MNIFKFQHPSDLISRLFILEYMREIGPQALYEKANKHQKELMFYSYEDNEGNKEVDVNWEYCIFVATLYQLEDFCKNFLNEIQQIESSREEIYSKIAEEKMQEEIAKPVDVNIMDLAATEIKQNQEGGFKLS